MNQIKLAQGGAIEIHAHELKVTKRNGQIVPFDEQRITRALCLAYHASFYTTPNESRDTAPYGVSQEHYDAAQDLTAKVVKEVIAQYGKAGIPSVEDVQSIIELQLIKTRQLEVVHHYISYRQRQAALRPTVHENNGLQEWLGNAKYTRYRENLGRREVWEEASQRTRDMHLRRFGDKNCNLQTIADQMWANGEISTQAHNDMGPLDCLGDEIIKAFELVEQKKVLPSMRSLQFGGAAIEKVEARIFNCSFSHVSRVEFFKEYFYLLLCGCGVGFSVQKHHVEKLPKLTKRGSAMDLPVQHYNIADTIEGWADALDKLLDAYIHGYHVEFSYSSIRPRGAELKTSGGKAPGHLPLKTALVKCEEILAGAAGRQMRPIEVYDICMFVAKAVLSGGIRRSATICLFSPDDEENAKSDVDWYAKHPQRSASNNSALIVRSEATREVFDKLFEAQKGADDSSTSLTPNHFQESLDPIIPETAFDAGIGHADSLPACGSLVGTSLVLTPDGVRSLERISPGDLLWTHNEWAYVREINVVGVAPVFRYQSTGGSIICGDGQLVSYSGNPVSISDLLLLERLRGPLSTGRSDIIHAASAVMDGLVIGDGSVHAASNGLVYLHVGTDDYDYHKSEVASLLVKHRPGISQTAWMVKSNICARELQHTYERVVPDRFIFGDFSTKISFLKGLYSANGSVTGERIALKATSSRLIEAVQVMLSSVGIASYVTTNKPHTVEFSNGVYQCRESYDLNITSDRGSFLQLIGFLHGYKMEALKTLVKTMRKSTQKKAPIHKIQTITPAGDAEVYSLKLVGAPKAVWVNGLAVFTC